MRLQIDTKSKIIKLEDKVLLKEFVSTLEKLLPKKEWQTFTLETGTVINNWSSPVIIREYKPWTYPWYGGLQYYSNNSKEYTVDCKNTLTSNVNKLTAGTYNVEL